ncbi:DUF4179 domain-containing protein [Ureibacillus sp. FSL W7-1570]|uniref:DUF4179 domain-containing protein n=1 Tax=Ureibacillus sp. FSL W7-1570 TaxID=2954593 RepID=UPI00315A8FBD
MVCPKEDKLLDYVEGILDEGEKAILERHLHSCPYCQQQLEFLNKENELLAQTLKFPTLPEDFAEKIVDQLEPYKSKKKRRLPWILGTAASALIAGGILLSVNPGFAKLVGGIFTSDSVDEGLRMAADTDIATPVNQSVTDAGITLEVEDLIADTTRIALSYRVTNNHGKTLNPFIDFGPESIKLLDEENKEIEDISISWALHDDDYGIFELSLADIEHFAKGMIRLDVDHLAGKDGHWQIDIPVDLSSAYGHQKVVELNESIEIEDVRINFNQVKYATSSTEIDYTLEYTEDAKKRLQQQLMAKEKQFGKEIIDPFFPYSPMIGFRIENSGGEVLGYENIYADENRGHPVSENVIGGRGFWDGNPRDLVSVNNIDSFVPKKNADDELFIVVDTLYRPTVSDFSITFKPEELPKTFEYNGYELTIDSIKEKTEISLEKSWLPVQRHKTVEIKMSGFAIQKAPELRLWAIVDKSGKVYAVNNTGNSVFDERDQHGRFKCAIELSTEEMEEIPDELTLHLIAEREVIPLQTEWRVPLSK